jgi:hypothetical protein
LDTEPAMMTSSPYCQFTGVETLCFATYVIGLGNNGEKIQFNSSYKLKAQGEKLITEVTNGDITVPQ